MTTADTTNAIIKYLSLLGHLAWRNSAAWVSGNGYLRKAPEGSKGIGDIVGVLSDGTHFEIDVKTGRDKASPYQLKHADEVHRRHGLYLFAKTFDDFEKQWKQITASPVTATAHGRAKAVGGRA